MKTFLSPRALLILFFWPLLTLSANAENVDSARVDLILDNEDGTKSVVVYLSNFTTDYEANLQIFEQAAQKAIESVCEHGGEIIRNGGRDGSHEFQEGVNESLNELECIGSTKPPSFGLGVITATQR